MPAIFSGETMSAGLSILVILAKATLVLVAALGGPQMQELCDTEYSSLFTLILVPGQPARLVHGLYGAPDEPADCGRQMKQ